ncbi:PINc domain-containing protein [Mycena indigotica]|uniref:PINc domain-containing protein n=1 Tax=Mycena indigotica TaxID=2126181 RepID=A0A8H6SB77_9AGAR|nr:PINc domain-containing protein [Mycena indigotica]KAF7295122.1 PINc domain-containing protein [Mycena indigotica]
MTSSDHHRSLSNAGSPHRRSSSREHHRNSSLGGEPSQTHHSSLLPNILPTPAVIESVAGAAHFTGSHVEPLKHRHSSHEHHEAHTILKADHRKLLDDLRELYECRPVPAIFTRSWHPDAVYETPLVKCRGFRQYAAQFYALAVRSTAQTVFPHPMHVDAGPESRATRKGRERDAIPKELQPTNIDQQLIMAKRRAARVDATRTRERPPPQSRKQPNPQLVVSAPNIDSDTPDADDFSRRLQISSSPTRNPSKQAAQPTRLYNPDRDPIPMRRTAEPENMSDAASSSYVSRGAVKSSPPRETAGRQLFDPRKDDPVRFVLRGKPPPTPKSSAEYVSASSTSSYAASMASSNFTLSSTTDGSSASSALFDRKSNPNGDDRGTNVFAAQLKKLYRAITDLETKIKQQDTDEVEDSGRVLLKTRDGESDQVERDKEREKWKRQIEDHKELAELIHNLLAISLAPSVPASLRNIPTKYNIIIRLWSFAFHKLLESLRRASFTSALALEHLQDFIYYAYTFYTGLLEEPTLNSFKSGWLEALGDLARYKMAVAAMVVGGSDAGHLLTTAAVSAAGTDTLAPPDATPAKSISDAPAARIDDSPSPSIGVAAARLLDVEPEKERWRCIARDWYGMGIADQPGHGKLHHHLGLLSREVDREELRGVYHFVKRQVQSMTTLHPFMTSRESVLPMWSASAQARRALPEARQVDLFILLHGMLFTNIQLDDFPATLGRFIERLEIEGADERDWTMMAVINICAILEYGKVTGVLKKAGGLGTREPASTASAMRVMSKRNQADDDKNKMDVDDEGLQQASPAMSEAEAESTEPPAAFRFAQDLTFAMLTHVLRHPMHKPSPYARSNLNPYLTVVLTFLATIIKHQQTLLAIERAVPWDELVSFFSNIPRHVMSSQGLLDGGSSREERWAMITTGCAPPLPEDWCLRGMEWVARKVYQHGFWKSGEDKRAEMEVLDDAETIEITDGRIEDDSDGEEGSKSDSKSAGDGELARRWVRVARCAVGIADVVEGFTWVVGTRQWRIEGSLAAKTISWKEEDRRQKEDDEKRRLGSRWTDDSMDVDQDNLESLSEGSDDDADDSEQVRALKARRNYLQSLLSSDQYKAKLSPSSRSGPRSSQATHVALPIVPGYTILVIDTNILLASLSMFSSLVESFRWTIVVPLPVIMELDGLSSNPSQLGEAAQAAMSYLSTHIRSHSTSLKVQTSKGNYLTSLNVRAEQVDFTNGTTERNMDDLILKAAIWQDEHWVDRSTILKSNAVTTDKTIKVVLLSLDRNLRLKARSRQLAAASERDLAMILVSGT